MLHSKKLFSFLLVGNLIACAIPQPGDKVVTKSVDAQLSMESPKSPQLVSEEYDSEISLPVSKKFQFSLCLKSSISEVEILKSDVVILTTDSETKNLNLDQNLCVQWEESISTLNKTEETLEISRQLEIKEKFKKPLLVLFSINPWTNEAKIISESESTKVDKTFAKSEKSSLELGFENLDLKVEKKSSGQFSLSLSGTPTLDGELLRYGKLVGEIIINKKRLELRGLVRDGFVDLKAKDNQFSCDAGVAQIEIRLKALTQKHSITIFQETHDLKACDQLEGSYSL